MRKFSFVFLILVLTVSVAFARFDDRLFIPMYSTAGFVSLLNPDDLSDFTDNGQIGISNRPVSFTFSPDGRFVYFGCENGNFDVQVLDVTTIDKGTPTIKFIRFTESANIVQNGIMFDASNNTLVLCTNGSGVAIIPLSEENLMSKDTNRETTFIFDDDMTSKTFRNSVLSGNKIYAAEQMSSKVWIYDKASMTEKSVNLSTVNSNYSNLGYINISPDEKWLLLGSSMNDKTGLLIELDTLETGNPVIKEFPRSVVFGEFSKDSKYVYYSSDKYGENYALYKCSVENLNSETKISLQISDDPNSYLNTNCHICSIGISEDEKAAYLISDINCYIYKVDLVNGKLLTTRDMTVLSNGNPRTGYSPMSIGGCLPSMASYKQYKDSIEININFEYNGFGGSDFTIPGVADQTVYYAATTSPTNMTQEKWGKILNPSCGQAEFEDWFKDKELTVHADLISEQITETVTFYAKWRKYNHKWEYYLENGKIFAYCDKDSDSCPYYGREHAISLGFNIGNVGSRKHEVFPENASNKNVSWVSDNPQVATIDKNGKIVGISKGTANITVSALDESRVSKSFPVRVEVVEKLGEHMFKNGVSTVVAFYLGNNNHWRFYFKYNDGLYEVVKVEHKGKLNMEEGKEIITEDYQDIDTFVSQGWKYGLEEYASACFAEREENCFNFKFADDYLLEINTDNSTYKVEFLNDKAQVFEVEDFYLIDVNGIKNNYYDLLTLSE